MSLHKSVEDGNLEEVKKILSLGADVNEKDEDGYTPLYYVLTHGYVSILKELLNNKNINVNEKNGCYEKTILHYVSMYYSLYGEFYELIKILLDYGADHTIKDIYGKECLDDLPVYLKNCLIEEHYFINLKEPVTE